MAWFLGCRCTPDNEIYAERGDFEMTSRPAFFPIYNSVSVDDTRTFEFSWNPGFSIQQKQKNVRALHEAIAGVFPDGKILEVSSKSTDELGVRLSAFNLSMPYRDGRCSVESVFQASKVFERSGPYPDLYTRNSREVRDFVKENAIGPLVAFEAHGVRWPLNPTRAFYDWIYIKTLMRNPDLAEAVRDYTCFTDIEFNPKKSLNCQAYAVALYLSMLKAGVLDEALQNKESFLKYHPNDVVIVSAGVNKHMMNCPVQGCLDL